VWRRRKNQVAGFRRLSRAISDGFFAIAHFADKDDFGSLTEARREAPPKKRRRIAVEFALVNGRFFLWAMEKFDGVFNGEDVEGLFFSSFILSMMAGKSGGFAGAGGAGDEDDGRSAGRRIFLELGRQFQVVEIGKCDQESRAMERLAQVPPPGRRKMLTRKRPIFLEAVREVGGAAFLELLGCRVDFLPRRTLAI